LQFFETIILEEADKFIQALDEKAIKKLFFVIRLAEQKKDPKLLKKLTNDIWEFRVKYLKKQMQILAFWNKENKKQTLVIATNCFYKKSQKTPKSEINKALEIRKQYLKNNYE